MSEQFEFDDSHEFGKNAVPDEEFMCDSCKHYVKMDEFWLCPFCWDKVQLLDTMPANGVEVKRRFMPLNPGFERAVWQAIADNTHRYLSPRYPGTVITYGLSEKHGLIMKFTKHQHNDPDPDLPTDDFSEEVIAWATKIIFGGDTA